MKLTHNIVTSWSVSYFWAIFSVFLATLSTYSFVQVDWIIKRNVIITSYNSNGNTSLGFSSTKSTSMMKFLAFNTTDWRSANRKSNSNKIKTNPSFQIRSKEYSDFYPSFYTSKTKEELGKQVARTVIIASFGALGVCTNYNESLHCETYNEKYRSVSSIWPILTLVGGSGCLILCVSAVMSILAVALPTSTMRYQAARTIGQVQAVSVVLIFLSLLVFPLGFGSEFVRFYCGPTAGPFDIGDCEIGWAYALVTVCASLSLYCPILVHFTINVESEYLPKHL